MTVDIATSTMVFVYVGMAGYIVYLQSKLHRIRKDASFMAFVIQDMAEGNVTVERKDGKLNITRTEK
jgi:hypothetical protein